MCRVARFMLTCQTDHTRDRCPCCLNELTGGLDNWHHVCNSCGYESAALDNRINVEAAALCEVAREDGLRTLRQDNFKELMGMISARLTMQSPALLEVGCGHGWFLELAARRFATVGIEPDHRMFLKLQDKGLNVIEGYFPDALNPTEKFDAIVFNDVLEHIADPEAALKACLSIFKKDGVLVLNLPTSAGLFYRMAKIGKQLGLGGAFERMWQKDFPSPHLHYFSAPNLKLLLQRCGFNVKSCASLPSIRLSGLYSRIAYADSTRKWRHVLLWFALVISYPLVRWFTSDIMVVLASADGADREF